jgi:hypothetical protein
MAYSTINKSTDYFNTATYTGTGSNQTISNTFQSDMIWVKGRNVATNHSIQDAVRGYTAGTVIYPNLTNAAGSYTDTGYIQSVASNNFVVGTGSHSDDANYNNNGSTYVAWNWKANGAGSSNSDGSVSATLSANATAGFSISTFTTPASGTFTVGHGLGVAPKFIIYRPVTSSGWQIGHDSIGWTKAVFFDTQSQQNSTAFGNTDPTNTVWTGNVANVGANASCVAYCFAEKTGYSRFSSYIGNGASNNGTFIYCGFRPAFAIFKEFESTNNWVIIDNKRNGYNSENYRLFPNLNNAEDTTTGMVDFVSNGIKIMSNNTSINKANNTFILMAFGQSLVGSNNVPCTAR